MMIGTAGLDALQRIADRASDVLDAYTPGATARFRDSAIRAQALPDADPLSVAAPNDAYLITEDARGARAFMASGKLEVDTDGVVRAPDGSAVLGRTTKTGPLVPLQLSPTDRALGRSGDVRIEEDGAVVLRRAAIDPQTRDRSTERVNLGTLALARFPAGSQPQRLDGARSAAPAGVAPHFGVPGDGVFGPLGLHTRLTGKIDIDTALGKLADAYVAFSALHAAQHARGGTDKIAMDLVK